IERLFTARTATHEVKEQASRQLALLLESTGVATLDGLERLEAAAHQRDNLRRELAKLDQELREIGAGLALADLITELRALAAVDIAVRLEELDEELERSDGEVDRATRSVISIESGLAKFETPRAAEEAQELMAIGAQIQRDVRDYARLR